MLTNHIRNYREKKSITQENLANAVGVSRQTIIAMEKGNYEPSLGLAFKLSKYFGVSAEELFVIR